MEKFINNSSKRNEKIYSLVRSNYIFLQKVEYSEGKVNGVVPSTMHQIVSICIPDGIVENIKVDQSFFLSKVN